MAGGGGLALLLLRLCAADVKAVIVAAAQWGAPLSTSEQDQTCWASFIHREGGGGPPLEDHFDFVSLGAAFAARHVVSADVTGAESFYSTQQSKPVYWELINWKSGSFLKLQVERQSLQNLHLIFWHFAIFSYYLWKVSGVIFLLLFKGVHMTALFIFRAFGYWACLKNASAKWQLGNPPYDL